MSSSSYLGHGAKYWADKYYELQTQTRLPDDPADLSWREKYLALEKECAHYQATLSDMRIEIEDLRSKSASYVPVSDHEAEKWRNAYWKLYDTLKQKENQCNALTSEKAALSHQLQTQTISSPELYNGHPAEWWYDLYQDAYAEQQKLQSKIRPLTISLMSCRESSEVGGHDAVYWCGQTQDLEAKLSKQQHSNLIVLSVAFILIAVVSVLSFMAGSGYLVPYYTPDSPYIASLKEAEEKAYSTGHHEGFNAGYDSASSQNYKSAYNKGWKNGYLACQEINQSIRNEYDAGYSAGYDVGWDDGWDSGHDDGLADGYQDAYDEGYSAGYADCLDTYK